MEVDRWRSYYRAPHQELVSLQNEVSCRLQELVSLLQMVVTDNTLTSLDLPELEGLRSKVRRKNESEEETKSFDCISEDSPGCRGCGRGVEAVFLGVF